MTLNSSSVTLDSLLINSIDKLVSAALEEDIGVGDLTATLIPKGARAQAKLICREAAVLCGRPWFDASFAKIDKRVELSWKVAEGADLSPDQLVCEISGNTRSILAVERTAINLLQTLSGTASLTRQYVEKIKGLNTEVLDTRKTIPGMRHAQKYATKIGGATNHRIGLSDGVLIKENHIHAAGSIALAVQLALETTPLQTLLEVEVESLQELQSAIDAGARRILLDNFTVPQLRAGVAMKTPDVKLEASGNVSLDSIREIAETGVDYISIGALTKHIQAVDFSLQFCLIDEKA